MRSKDKLDISATKKDVAETLKVSQVKEDFIAKLKERNIDVVFRYTDEGRIYGVIFVDNNTMTVLNGSRLGKEYSANALNSRFSKEWHPKSAEHAIVSTSESSASQGQNTANTGEDKSPTHHTQNGHSIIGSHDEVDFSIPGLDLFQQGQSFNPDEEAFRRRMQRKKKKGYRPKF